MEKLQLFTTLRCDPALMTISPADSTDLGWNSKPSPFYMLDFHRDRLLKAALHWGWDAAVKALEGDDGLRTLDKFLRENVQDAAHEPYRAKVLVDRDGVLSIVKAPTGPVSISNLFPSRLPAPSGHTEPPSPASARVPQRNLDFEVLLDREATAKTEFTHFKTTYRPMYDEARRRTSIGLTDKKEVLLVNDRDGSIMEGSITTPYFWRGGRWVTPPISKEFDPTQGSGGNNGTTRRWALERNLAVEEVVLASSLVDGEECWISNGVRGFIHAKVKL
ncbi:putative 4-amino-4-deoxychorismate protein [Xylariaceae sp. FL0594]|nr:putative 4-amino-4-deoxychorismate protein [Xylariaceae sp. FL0594]